MLQPTLADYSSDMADAERALLAALRQRSGDVEIMQQLGLNRYFVGDLQASLDHFGEQIQQLINDGSFTFWTARQPVMGVVTILLKAGDPKVATSVFQALLLLMHGEIAHDEETAAVGIAAFTEWRDTLVFPLLPQVETSMS